MFSKGESQEGSQAGACQQPEEQSHLSNKQGEGHGIPQPAFHKTTSQGI